MAGYCDNFSMNDGGDQFYAFPGLKGEDGKSAYEAAQEGGYTGTEAQFNTSLSEVDTALQPSDVDSALSATSTNPVQNKVITAELADQKSIIEDLEALTNRKAGALIDTASGSIASFVPDATIPDLLGVTVAVEPVQAGSGDPSPDNVRPISGWDAVNIWDKPTHDTTADPTVTVQLGQTVYGGTLDAVNGTLVVDRRYIVADGVNINVSGGYGASGPNWLPCIVLSSANKSVNDSSAIRASYLSTGNFQNAENSIGVGNGGAAIILHIGTMQGNDGTHGYNNSSEVWNAVNAYLQEHPLQICYKLATPITIQLDPVTIAAIAGQTNNVWADAGDVSVEFAADTKLYIDNAVPNIADVLSELCYSKGEYVEIDTACYGVITSSKKRAEINIVLPKRLPSNATINVTYLHSYLFLPDGSRIGGAANYDLLANATIAIRRADTVLLIWATSSTDLGNIDNVPISGGVVCRFTIN